VLLSASGKLFRQETARRFAKLDRIVLLCGRYEGVDERVAEHLATDEISIGDFVLSGGELPAALIVDSVARLIPGALGNEDSAVNESFSEFHHAEKTGLRDLAMLSAHDITGALATAGPALSDGATLANSGGKSELLNYESRIGDRGILDFPHYTRPPSFRGWDVPEVLLGGHHEEIRRWRRQKAIEKTLRNRPDLLDMAKQGKSER
jgi:tRNA (guanine37-N1)-methyltransferase